MPGLTVVSAASLVLAISYSMPDPVAFELGPIAVRWYGLAYMVGLLIGWQYVRMLLQRERIWQPHSAPLATDQADSLLLWATLGVVVGGRLGYVLFYQPVFFLHNPEQIYQVWKGGMSFHGGLVGTGLVLLWFARANGVRFLSLTDVVAAAVPIGLFFGRIANFINGEVYGRETDVPWAIIFPREVLLPHDEVVPRHPSQLYEGVLEGIVLFLVLYYFIHRRGVLKWPGVLTGLFLAGYGLARIACEFFRAYEPEHFLSFGPYLTPGMVYSLPMVVLGAYLLHTSRFRAESAAITEAAKD